MRSIKNSLIKILLIDKLPYLLSLLFLGAGLAISHIIKEVKLWPLLEYHISEAIKGEEDSIKGYYYRITISNITTDLIVKNVSFLIDYNNTNGWKIISAIPQFKPPAHFLNNPDDDPKDDLAYQLTVSNFQPNWEFDVIIFVTGSKKPTLSFYSEQSINLVERSLKTYIFRNQINFMIVLTLLWITMIISYLFVYVNLTEMKDEKK